MEMKVCSRCGIEKPVLEFVRSRTCKGGFKHQCKECDCKHSKQRYATRKEAGLCVQCGKPVSPGLVVCEYHRELQRRDSAKELNKSRTSGICARCNIYPAVEGSTTCQKCIDEQKAHRRNRKRDAVRYLGGKCVGCGLETERYEQYDFHHVKGKDSLSQNICKIVAQHNWEKVKEELNKCVLLCANCHRTRHVDEREGNWLA